MRFFLNDGLERLQIVSGDHIRRFNGVDSARTFLRRFVDEPRNLEAMREALGRESGPATDDEIVERLAERLVRPDLRVVTCASHFTPALEIAVEAAAGTSPQQTTPLEDEQAAQAEKEEEPAAEEEHWLEIELVDDEGNPVPGELYVVELPDGSTVSGRLDGNGFARLEGIDPGTAKVSFPELDKELYEPE